MTSMEDDSHRTVEMLEHLGVLQASGQDSQLLDDGDHDVRVLKESHNQKGDQQQQRDASVGQEMINVELLQLTELPDVKSIEKARAGETHAEPDQVIQSIPEPPNRQNRPPQPGAFPYRGINAPRLDDGASHSITFGLSEESATMNTGLESTANNHHGLVSAEPVSLPSFSADPVEPDDIEQGKKHRNSSLRLLGIFGVFVALVVGIILIILLVERNQPDENLSASTSQESVNASDFTPPSPTPWAWDLPFSVSNLTVYTIEQDTKRTTPQAKAYDWMKNDPKLETYSSERLLQRFVMVLFYFATEGEEWTIQGGGTIPVLTDHQSRPGTQRQRSLLLQSSSRQLQQQGTNMSGSAVSQGTPGFSGGDPPPGDSNGQSNPYGPPPDAPPQGYPSFFNESQASGGINGTNGEGISPGPPSDGTASGKPPSRIVNITSEPWLDYNSSECEWFSTAGFAPDREACNDLNLLEYFGVMGNNLGGRLPLELGLLSNIRALEMARNKIGGQVISELGTLSSLRLLHLFENDLTGSLPSELGQLKLDLFAFFANQLTGTVPASIWRISTLKDLRLGHNAFFGSLPNDIGTGKPELKGFQIPDNQFTGSIPTSLGMLTQLQILVLSDNRFSGSLPSELGNLTKLNSLNLGNNHLSGIVPSELGQLTNLAGLKLEGNVNIRGTLPTSLAALNGILRELRIKDTSITGTIPAGLCQVQDLSFDCSPSLCGCNCSCEAA